jgi:hypothetical protein
MDEGAQDTYQSGDEPHLCAEDGDRIFLSVMYSRVTLLKKGGCHACSGSDVHRCGDGHAQ